MKKKLFLIIGLLFIAISTWAQSTYTFPGNSLSGSFGSWGGTGYFYSPIFNVNAPGGIDIVYYNIDVSQFTEANTWTTKGVAMPGVSKTSTMMGIDPNNNSIWCNILNMEIASGTDWDGHLLSTLGPDGILGTSDDSRHQGTQDWYRPMTGGKIDGPAAGPYYNNESYVIPNPRHPLAPPKTATELNSYDFRIRILPTGPNAYTYEMWFRMHNSAAQVEGAYWVYNIAMNNSADAWKKFAQGTTDVFPISNIDFSKVHVFMGLGNFQDPATQTLTWGNIEVTGTLADPEVNLYVSTSITSPYGNTIFPNITWDTPLTTVSDGFNWTPSAANHDWTYKDKKGTFYIIPVGALSPLRSFNAATIKLVWNPIVVSEVTITEGDFFSQGGKTTLFTTNIGSNWVIIDASCLEQNQTPDGSKYIAKLDFKFNGTESGFSGVAIDAVTLLYMDGSNEYEVITGTQNMGGKFKCFLGDFASTGSPISYNTGDGLITGTDLSPFTLAYWSHYNDLPTTLYKSKYDIGPTTPARYYFGKPTPDGTIGFEDLAIFAMGYSKTASGTLPDNPSPIAFSLDKISKEANGTLRLPVRISGSINDLRAYSLKLNYSGDMEYTGVEMAGEMLEGTNFLIGKSETGKVYSDGAFLGTGTGLSKEGVIAYVLFNEKTQGNHNASIENVIARNSGNLDLEVSFAGSNTGVGVPKTFSLNQNYPNPFNPVTKIEYAVPNDMKVTIKVYDMIGREVSVLVNEIQKAGYYSVEWNGNQLSSGVYFYKMQAGDFNAVKKMLMIK